MLLACHEIVLTYGRDYNDGSRPVDYEIEETNAETLNVPN